MSSESAVREAATNLFAAITAAENDGYRIAWPSSAAGLPGIAISETGAVKRPDPKPAAPARHPASPKPGGGASPL
jgi:hypothetical protein